MRKLLNNMGIENKNRNMTNFTISSLVVIVLLAILPIGVSAQFSSVAEAKEHCIKALKNNDVDALVKSFSDPVEITLPESENSYSKTQAAMVLRKFLNENKVNTFSVKQSGKSTGGSEFIIGDMTTTTGKKYQVYFLITIINEKAFLHLIEFELI
jgi:S1-C subfamily serine protease